MKSKNLRFRSKMLPILHLASWIAYLYATYCLNESRFGSGLMVVVLFPLYAVSFYSIYFFFKYSIDYQKPLSAFFGVLIFLILILPFTNFYVDFLQIAFDIQMQSSSTTFSWKEFAQSTYLGVFRIGIYASIAYMIGRAFRATHLQRILSEHIQRLKFKMLSIQLTSHTQFDLLHRLMGRFDGDREGFEQYVEWLADMQGYTASGLDITFVPLQAEIDQAWHLVFMLEPMYFAENLNWLEVHGAIDDVEIPPMVLVSLLENACKYADFRESDAIKMKARVLDNILLIYCENTIGSNRANRSLKIGNNNLKARLNILYGNRAFHNSFQKEGRYIVQITIHFAKTKTTNITA